MAVLKNWSLVRVHFSDSSKKYLTTRSGGIVRGNPFYAAAIMGNCYGKIGVKGGTFIITKMVEKINDAWGDDVCAVTINGEIYTLGRKNPDYEKFEKAVEEGITVLRNWSIHRDGDTCYLKVKDENEKETMKKILSRKEWIVTFEDNSVAFLDWASVDDTQLNYLKMFVF